MEKGQDWKPRRICTDFVSWQWNRRRQQESSFTVRAHVSLLHFTEKEWKKRKIFTCQISGFSYDSMQLGWPGTIPSNEFYELYLETN